MRPFTVHHLPSTFPLMLPRSVFFGHLLGDKGPFQRKRMAVHVNEDALFTAEIGQTCARCILTNSASARAKRAGGRRPGAKFLLRTAVNKLGENTRSAV